jgi:hypothetical protein
MRRAPIACAALLCALVACSPAEPVRVDASTPESTERSLQEMERSLSEHRREQLSEALAVVIPAAMGGGVRDVGNTPEVRARVQAALQGKTAAEIIADADRIRREFAARETPQP